MDYLTTLYQQYAEFTRTNQGAGAAVLLWFLGTLTVVLRNAPALIVRWFKHHWIYTATVYDTQLYEDARACQHVEVWLFKRLKKNIKQIHLSGDNNKLGVGYQWFFYYGRFIRVNVRELASEGTDMQRRAYEINLFSFSQSLRTKLTKEIKYQHPPRTNYLYAAGQSGDISRIGILSKRNLNTITTSGNLHLKTLERLKHFLANEQWYLDNGIPYKHVILLHGPPGTGKTTILKMLASETERDLVMLDTTAWCQNLFGRIYEDSGKSPIVAFEDLDRTNFKDRIEHFRTMGGNTSNNLSVMLNLLDGVYTPHGLICVITMNDISTIEPALLRPGRINDMVYIDVLQPVDVMHYIKHRYGDVCLHDEFTAIAASTLSDLYARYPSCYKSFYTALMQSSTEKTQ